MNPAMRPYLWIGFGIVVAAAIGALEKLRIHWALVFRLQLLSSLPPCNNSDTQRDPLGLGCLQLVAFFFGLRPRCERPRQKDIFPFAALVHNPSAQSSNCSNKYSKSEFF